MRPLLPRLLAITPAVAKRQALVQLFEATAAAFQCQMPTLRGLTRDQCLLAYARFTSERAGDALRRGDDLAELQAQLYSNAYRLGRLPGRLLRIRSVDDVMTVAGFLYDILDIGFVGSGGGEITISRCYFSRFYSPQACRLMSAMDGGLLAGLAGRGHLSFSQRITEGQACCRAQFAMGDRRSLSGATAQEQIT